MEQFICKYCGKICKNQNSLRNHERLCKQNPNHQEHTGYIQGWNKGLTKQTDERINKISKSLKKRYYKEFKPYHCEECGKLVTKNYGSGRFCSKICATRFVSKQDREIKNKKTSITLRKNNLKTNENLEKLTNEEIVKKSKTRICVICGKEYTYGKGINVGKTCSKECSFILKSNISKIKVNERIANGTHKGWTTRNIASFPEKFFKTVLENNNIEYEFNKPIKKSDLGINEASCYFLDFALSNKIDLEIDGKQHETQERKISDQKRDAILKANGWKVYRIKWKNLPKYRNYIKEEINKFLIWYKENS